MNEIDKFILGFPEPVQTKLHQLRNLILKEFPELEEKISYGIPSYYSNGPLVHFSGFKSHIGFYPAPSAIVHFQKELSIYKTSKGAIQFPLEQNLPVELIRNILRFRMQENCKKSKVAKGISQTCVRGHVFLKSSSCPVCPKCEAMREDYPEWMRVFAAPARRALLLKSISKPEDLKKFTLEELHSLHGIGPGALNLIKKLL